MGLLWSIDDMFNQGTKGDVVPDSSDRWWADSMTVVSRIWVGSLPSGKHTRNYGKSPCLMGKSAISMAIFNSKVLVYQREYLLNALLNGEYDDSPTDLEVPYRQSHICYHENMICTVKDPVWTRTVWDFTEDYWHPGNHGLNHEEKFKRSLPGKESNFAKVWDFCQVWKGTDRGDMKYQ